MPTPFQMQAKSSADGRLYSWLSSTADRSGSGFPGPGSPQDVVVYSGSRGSTAIVPIRCAITAPTAGTVLVVGTPITITGTISQSGTVSIAKGTTVLGSATVVGLNWSYSWTPLSGDAGAVTLNATATDASNGTLASASVAVSVGISITGYTAVGTAQNSWKWDTQKFTLTGSAPNQYVVGDQGTRLRISVPNGCGYLDIEAVSTLATGIGLGNTVDIVIDGVAQRPSGGVGGSLQFTTPGVKQTLRLTVPGTGTRIVELYEQACYITGLTPQTTASILPYAAPTRSVAIFGASGSQGYYSYDPANVIGGVMQFILSWVGQFKTSGRWGSVYLVASGGYGSQDHLSLVTPTNAGIDSWLTAQVLPRCDGTVDQSVVYEFGAGDFFHANWTAANFTTYYGMIADRTRLAQPALTQYWKTPIICNNPAEGVANSNGVTMQQVRDAIIAMAAARPWITLINGYLGGSGGETQNTGQLQDNLHCTAAAEIGVVATYNLSLVA